MGYSTQFPAVMTWGTDKIQVG